MNLAGRTCNPLTKSVEVGNFLVNEGGGVKSRLRISVGTIKCSAVKQSSTAAAETKVAPKSVKPKVGAKPLVQLMEEEVIPPLKATFEAQDDLSEIQVSFQDNRLEGSFSKNGTRYSFWAFFPDGAVTGAKGFSLSSYGSGVSTVEPFLIDEKKITAKHVVFWVEKRLAAQGILPVWNQDM